MRAYDLSICSNNECRSGLRGPARTNEHYYYTDASSSTIPCGVSTCVISGRVCFAYVLGTFFSRICKRFVYHYIKKKSTNNVLMTSATRGFTAVRRTVLTTKVRFNIT
jgi:hypothetical protein